MELWRDWRRRPLLTPKRPKLQNFAPPTWKIHNLWGVRETMSICQEKIQAKFDRLGLKHLGPAWRGYNCQTARAAHRSDDIPCAGMARTQGASMGGFGRHMWVHNTQEVWCSNSKICGSDTPNSLAIYLIWSVRCAYACARHAQARTHGHTGLGTCWGTLLDGLGKLTASNFEKIKSFEIFKICMGKTV